MSYFFQTLPNLSAPAPNTTEPGNILALIPVFDDPYFFGMFPDYLKAAIYAQQTWLLHSDARDENVAIKLYIEDTQRSKALPILEANGIPETDVIWFNAPPLPDTENGFWGRLGKKLCLYWDPQLAAYEKIVYWDADTFKLPDPKHRNFFARAADEMFFNFIQTATSMRSVWRPQMIRSSVNNVYLGKLPIQDIFARAGLGRVLQEVTGPLTRPIGLLSVYPAATFRSQYSQCLTWIRDYGPYIGDDEFVIGLAASQFEFPLCSLSGWGLTAVSVGDYFAGDTDHAFIHGKPIPKDTARYTDLLTTIGNYQLPTPNCYNSLPG